MIILLDWLKILFGDFLDGGMGAWRWLPRPRRSDESSHKAPDSFGEEHVNLVEHGPIPNDTLGPFPSATRSFSFEERNISDFV
jgi:hypothetical protein